MREHALYAAGVEAQLSLDYVLAGCSCQIIFKRFVLAAVDRQRLDSLAAALQSPNQDKVSFERRSQVLDQGTEEWNAGLPGYALGDLEDEMLKQTIDFGRRVHAYPTWNKLNNRLVHNINHMRETSQVSQDQAVHRDSIRRSFSRLKGFGITSFMPAAMHSARSRAGVVPIIGVAWPRGMKRIRAVASKPSITGICQPIKTSL